MKPLLREILAKITGNDQRAIRWLEMLGAAAIPEGGATSQVLAKISGTSFDMDWVTVGGGGGPVAWVDITGKPTFAAVATTGAYGDLSGIPGSFTPSAHTHALADLTVSGATAGQVPQWNGATWVPVTPSGGGASGSATLDFGALPGGGVASVAVTGQTGILLTSRVKIWLQAEASADFNATEHSLIFASRMGLSAGNIIAGAGFTIFAETELRLAGKITVRWEWS